MKRQLMNFSGVRVYLNLRFLLARCWFIDGHFHSFLFVSNDNRTKRRILSMNHTVIHRPEPMKLKSTFIPFGSILHFIIRHISHDMIDEIKFSIRPRKLLFRIDQISFQIRLTMSLIEHPYSSMDVLYNSVERFPNNLHVQSMYASYHHTRNQSRKTKVRLSMRLRIITVWITAIFTDPCSSVSVQMSLTIWPPLARACSMTCSRLFTVNATSFTPSPCRTRCAPYSWLSGVKGDWKTRRILFCLITCETTSREPVSKPRYA